MEPLRKPEESLISADRVFFSYAPKLSQDTILEDFSATVSCNEVVAIIGESGSGKSTLLKVLAGLEKPTSGTILHRGVTPGGFVFQSPVLINWLNVEDNIAFPLRLAGADNGRVEQLIYDLDLVKAKKKYPRELSGGMRSRVQLARALFREPRVLFLDEPFSPLDERLRFQMNDLFKRLRSIYKFSALLVSHSIQEAVLLADRIWHVRHAARYKQVTEYREGLRFSHSNITVVDDPGFIRTVAAIRKDLYSGAPDP